MTHNELMTGYDDGRVACTDRVSAELAAHGVNVSSGREAGLR
jgi:hypothetical protein